MSFFRTLLEDEVNVLPGHNDGSAEAKELMAEIDAAEVNEDEVDDAQAAKFSPDDGVEKIVDEMYMAIAEHEMSWNEFVQESGLEELTSYSKSSFNEGALDSVKDFFSKVKQKIKEFFEKVWQVIKRWASNMFSFMHTNKKFASKYAGKISSGYQIYKKDKSVNRVEGYPFSNLEQVFNTFTGKVDVKRPENEEDGKKVLARIRGKYAGAKSEGDGFREKVLENIRGAKSREKLDISGQEIVNILQDDSITKKKVNEAMKQSKKEFKDAIREVDRLQKEAEEDAASAEKAAARNRASANSKMYMVQATNIREQLKILQVVRSCLLSCISARARQARHIGNLYVRLANRSENKGFRNESANYGFLSANLI